MSPLKTGAVELHDKRVTFEVNDGVACHVAVQISASNAKAGG
jgi:hypothetical protein